MSDALYLTDSERPLRNEPTRARYRFWLTFQLRQTVYTRWFRSPEDRRSYLQTLDGATFREDGEDRIEHRLAEQRRIDAINGWRP